jgi:O-acetyl-ADP-ribose deacetylase (regulator of RNase III)
MIKYIEGNILNCKEKVIAHGCNAHGVMGSGVAKILRDKYPEIFPTYQALCLGEGNIMGDIVFVPAQSDNIVICNMITQQNYGKSGSKFVSYDAIDDCFHNFKLVNMMKQLNTGLAIPKIGAGLGGGDWDIIEKIIEKASTKHGYDVTVYVYNP